MPLQQGEYLSITPAAQKLALLMLIVVCVAPALFNLLGINFSSYTQPIFPQEQQAVLNTLKNLTFHATLEWSAVIFTLLGAAASFIHYALKRNILVPIIGIGLFASGLLDVFHNVITTTSVHELSINDLMTGYQSTRSHSINNDLIAFTWTLSRVFFAVTLLFSLLIHLNISSGNKSQSTSFQLSNQPNKTALLCIVITGFIYLVIALSVTLFVIYLPAIPEQFYLTQVIVRPYELIPIIFFALSVPIIFQLYKKDSSFFLLVLLFSLMPAVFSQFHSILGSIYVFDKNDNIAHAFKILSYSIIFIGIIYDLILFPSNRRNRYLANQSAPSVQNSNETTNKINAHNSSDHIANDTVNHRYVEDIANAVPVLLAYVDKEYRYQFVNDKYALWIGTEKEEVVGRTVYDVLGKNTCERLTKYFTEVFSGKQTKFNSKIPYNGIEKQISTTYTPDINDQDKVIGFFVSIEDRTDLIDAEAKLEELSWRMNFALDSSNIGIWDLDISTNNLIWDHRMFSLFEENPCSPNETFGIWKSKIHPEDYENTLVSFKESIELGSDFNIQFRIILANGNERHIYIDAKFIRDNDDKALRVVGIAYDITEQEEHAQTREMALHMAQQSAELKSGFLASMSHEIRTPMNGVMGMLGLLQRTQLDDQQQHYARLAHSSADSLLVLINDILDFSKIEAGKLDIEIIEFDLLNLLTEFSESMAFRTQDKDLEIILDASKMQYSMVSGDPGRVRQILTNLVSNAIKFTQEGTIVIHIELTAIDNETLLLNGFVSDSGMGIPEHVQNELFNAFTQADVSTTREFGGTGLGLSIVKQLCELMGGSINVESEVGKGSRFNFNFNLHPSVKSPQALPDVLLQDKRVLVVDDNEASRAVVKAHLELLGISVTESKDAFQALEILASHEKEPFSAAMIDMKMPKMNGAELGEKIRSNAIFDDMPILLMTSQGERGDAQYFADIGFKAYFTKPITTSNLFKALSIMIDNGKALESCVPLITQHNINSSNEFQSSSDENSFDSLETTNPLENVRILLAEDNAINTEITLNLLEDLGINADTAEDGLEVIKQLNNSSDDNQYQLILMDCQMPNMDGYEATECIRQGRADQRYIKIPIVALTASAMKGDMDRCLDIGMNDYLSKPISPILLKEVLVRWISDIPSEFTNNDNIKDNEINNIPVAQPESPLKPKKESQNEILGENTMDLQIWDEQAALKRVGNRPERIKILINMFLTDMPDRMVELSNNIDSSTENVSSLAHAVKGIAGNLSGLRLFEQANQLEQAAKIADQNEINNIWPLFTHEYEELCRTFNTFLEAD